MGILLRDFYCANCDEAFEEMVNNVDLYAPCITCGTSCHYVPSKPKIGKFASASPQEKADILRKRSHDDTIKQVKKEPEKFGMKDPSPWNTRNKTGA